MTKSKKPELEVRKGLKYDSHVVYDGHQQVFCNGEPLVDTDFSTPRKYEEYIAEIDLNDFSCAGSRRLLEDLIDRPEGVKYNKRRHGANQPKSLRQRLTEKGYEYIAKDIHKKKDLIYLKSLRISKKV